jgi:lycopene cyclase domain-containing protein
MLPPVAAAWFGASLAARPAVALEPLLAVSLAAFFAVYTAHVKDGYVDFHVRGEDADHPLTARGCRLGLAGATLGFVASLAAVAWLSGPVAATLLAPTWLLGYLHAPTLDTHPVGATAGYPLGVAILVVAGHHAQAGALSARVLAFALVFLVVLCGVKVIDDATDHDYDRSIDKRTVAVVLGPARARRLAEALLAGGLFAVVALAVDGLFPPSAAFATLPLAVVGLYARRADPELATMLLVRGVYLLLAGLVVATYFRPLSGLALPRISVLGPYTYLATEVVFGAAALALLVRADALARAARTVAALYPVAYLWDWYTLEVGVFAIPLRTGVELLGIPLEEHLFMLVVPALVVGVHETVNGRRASRADPDEP